MMTKEEGSGQLFKRSGLCVGHRPLLEERVSRAVDGPRHLSRCGHVPRRESLLTHNNNCKRKSLHNGGKVVVGCLSSYLLLNTHGEGAFIPQVRRFETDLPLPIKSIT